MSIYSFRIPGPPAIPPVAPPTPSAASVATPQTGLGALLDQLIDPVTLDYVRGDNGEWVQTADSRTIMLIMLETELAASPFFPGDGTRIKALLREGEPVTPEILQAETLRAGRILQLAGVISDLSVTTRDVHGDALYDEAGRSVVLVRWRDLVGGSPVDLVLQAAPNRAGVGAGGGGDIPIDT